MTGEHGHLRAILLISSSIALLPFFIRPLLPFNSFYFAFSTKRGYTHIHTHAHTHTHTFLWCDAHRSRMSAVESSTNSSSSLHSCIYRHIQIQYMCAYIQKATIRSLIIDAQHIYIDLINEFASSDFFFFNYYFFPSLPQI